MSNAFRIETDTMGEMRVPSSALYGAETLRIPGRAGRRLFPERRAAHLRRGPDEDRERHSVAWLRPALRTGRIEAAGGTAWLQHHAGKGEPGDCREPPDGLRAGDRQRHDGRLVRGRREFRTECHDAGDGLRPAGFHRTVGQRFPELRWNPAG